MFQGKQVQLLSVALVVAFAFSGCRARQQPRQMYQPAVGPQMAPSGINNQLIPIPDSIPTPDSLPMPTISTSSKPRRGILRLLPSFRRNRSNNVQRPPEGKILTEEEFNALPGKAVPLMPGSTSNPTPVDPSPQPAEQLQQLPVHERQAQIDQPVPIRPVSSVVATTAKPGLIRNFGPKTFESVSEMNFGGAWGQAVAQPVPQQQVVTTDADPLEIPEIDNSYDLWPQAPADSRDVVSSPATTMAPESTSVSPAVTVSEHFGQTATYELPTAGLLDAAMPMIVPAPRD